MKHLQTITIRGEPNAQKRHKHHVRGKFAQVYDPSAQAKEDYRIVLQQQAPAFPYSGALYVDIDCYFSRPKSHYGTGKNAAVLKADAPPFYHTKKPDGDNCVKFVFDALNGIFWKDDAMICSHKICKWFSEAPRTQIMIYSMDEYDPEVKS